MIAWNDDDRRAVCKAFYTDGESAGVIAARLSVSRNAVIGVVHRHAARLGFIARKQVRPAGNLGKAPKRPQPSVRRMPPSVRPKPLPDAAAVIADPLNLTMLGVLNGGGCKFAVTRHDAPRDAHLFCGQPRAGGFPYCAGHVRLTTKPS